MYSTETLPTWFWIIYYCIMFLTIAAATYAIKENRNRWMSLISIFLTLSIPLVGIVNGIESRVENQDELEQWLFHLGKGSLWAYYILFGYIYLIVWWVQFLRKSKKQSTSQIR